ncbi:lysine-2,3-aminomutase-like protein [Parasaccharibacter apium]|uniref:lysine-2,3-aminomutase-like protein n=1 Tax=Parasaccharibacter apium TaxID=1510841 RepID=UPI0009DABB66|nr:lysine-2,3-aminomutase-like protein [Parasaccharibacter apium]MCQ0040647.1 lysine-2,3-aminomutase-like protein [Bombella sp.]MUH03005.1 lysine-2,3-aminomutase-like protein [Bombella sp. ESL0387]
MHDTASSSPSGRTLRSTQSLLEAKLITPEQAPALEEVARHYATAIPPAFQRLITSPDDPIARQVIPDARELRTMPHESEDPIGDEALSPVPGIVHRYEDRALLKPLLVCPLYCRFCFRREHVGPDGGLLGEEALETAFHWIEAHPQIREIILTGGDPLMLSPRRMQHIIQRLSSISHIDIIRIHSRVPVAAPERLTTALLDAMETDRALWMVAHINHARELTDKARVAVRQMLGRGIPVLSQSVLLRGVNDTTESLEALLRALIAARIKPYYLHHLDSAPGTAHFHVPVEEGRALLESLRGRVSGLVWPTYVVDIPGGKGKVPLGPDYLVSTPADESSGSSQARGPDGKPYPFT